MLIKINNGANLPVLVAVLVIGLFAADASYGALVDGQELRFFPATGGITHPSTGSWAAFGEFDGVQSGGEVVNDVWVYFGISPSHGIQIGSVQDNVSVRYSGCGSAFDVSYGDIDLPWCLFEDPAAHVAQNSIEVVSLAGGGIALDFSGWGLRWFRASSIVPLNNGAWGGNHDGLAALTCSSDCRTGDDFTLDYSATVPQGDYGGLEGYLYKLHLEGEILQGASVPLVPSLYYFFSGLLGLVAVKRRRKNS